MPRPTKEPERARARRGGARQTGGHQDRITHTGLRSRGVRAARQRGDGGARRTTKRGHRLERRRRARRQKARAPASPTRDGVLQAGAAAGQSVLMRATKRRSRAPARPVAQVLLTHADLADRTRANNARDALAALLEAGAVPIINENDAVAVEEIGFGDNDELAAMVRRWSSADLLDLLSDVGGVARREGAPCTPRRSVAREARPLAASTTAAWAPAAWRARWRRHARDARRRTW